MGIAQRVKRLEGATRTRGRRCPECEPEGPVVFDLVEHGQEPDRTPCPKCGKPPCVFTLRLAADTGQEVDS